MYVFAHLFVPVCHIGNAINPSTEIFCNQICLFIISFHFLWFDSREINQWITSEKPISSLCHEIPKRNELEG